MKSITHLFVTIGCVILPLAALAQSPALLRTFDDLPGSSYYLADVAALGNDRVLLGGSLLFHTNGTLLTTFTVPQPPTGFGSTIAAVGNDRVAIGASYGGSVYLFATNGAMLTNISVISGYVSAVVGVGNDKLLIGDHYANEDPNTWATYGAAYLYNTKGALLTTFTNSSAGTVHGLGSSVAAFGSDRVLIGASTESSGHGGAYLFHINGTLLMTFTNPAPSIYDYYGHSVAAVGTDRILVGSPADGPHPEKVYLFNTNGTLLLTITNPTPAADDWFGYQITALGNDRVVIGAPSDDTAGVNSGSAYLFNLNGTLLATLNNPTPAAYDRFGRRLAAVGNNGVTIGNGSGFAYLFSVPAAPAFPSAPSLTIRQTTTNTLVVSWPSTATGFVLQQNTNGITSANWSTAPGSIQDNGTTRTLIVNPTGGNRFFRLVSP